jgi:hypothetical protein
LSCPIVLDQDRVMPTIARRLAAQHEPDRLQARRLRAGELFVAGVRQAEVARRLDVSRQSVHLWHQRWQAAGADGLRSRGPTGPAPRLSDVQLRRVEQALLRGAGSNGFVGELCGTVASSPKVPPAGSKVETLPVQTAVRSAQSEQS